MGLLSRGRCERDRDHVNEIDTLEELVVQDKGFIDLERANPDVELFTSGSQRSNVEPWCEGKNDKIDKREIEKPWFEVLEPHPREAQSTSRLSTEKSPECWRRWKEIIG